MKPAEPVMRRVWGVFREVIKTSLRKKTLEII